MVTSSADGPLAPFRRRNRPLLVFAPSPGHPEHEEQVRRVRAATAGFRERDMVLVEVFAGEEARADDRPLSSVDADVLRREFGVGPDAFAAILVGRDGTEKRRWDGAAPLDEVFALIDSMPMRREEMHDGDA